MPVMQGLLKEAIRPENFEAWLHENVAPKMGAWRPRGVVLHNTGKMQWPGHDINGNQISPAQRIENMSVDWVARGFKGGPHLLIAPDGLIYAVWPLWLPGTHSPSWNSTFWGMEMVGDFDLEPFPLAMQHAATVALRGLYNMLGHAAAQDTFHLHKEDPRTTHKHCPGKNCGDKATWLSRINALQAPLAALDLPHLRPVPAGADAFIRAREGFRLVAYPDGQNADGTPKFALGYGTQIKPDGTRVVEGETCTMEQAAAWQSLRTAADWDHVQQLVKVPITDGQATVLLSFSYQYSVGRLAASTFLELLNQGDYSGAADNLMTWNKVHDASGALVESPGITKRRKLELALWNAGAGVQPVQPKETTGAVPNPGTVGNGQNGEKTMDNSKPWWTSQTIWGGVGAVLAGGAATYASLKNGDANGAAANAMNTYSALAGILAAFGGLQAIIGRFRASKAIGKAA